MKKAFKKNIAITGASGLLGSHFYNKYKNKYRILKCPHRIENFTKIKKWISGNSFNYFIHFAAITKNESKKYYKTLNLINVKSSINLLNVIIQHLHPLDD